MPDVLGYRGKWGVLVPSTNTVVEPDFYAMVPHGVTLHTSRIFIGDQNIPDNAAFEALMEQIRASLSRAIEDVKTCEPDYLVMGMSSETFWGGVEGNRAFIQRVEAQAGVPIATGADAVRAALETLGVRRVGIVTPYQPVGDAQVRRYFEDCGFEIINLVGLRCISAIDIAMQTENRLREALREADGPDVEALVQVGTNLSMLRLADEAERWMGKPVIAINAAILWHALRQNGIREQRPGFGVLLREF
jgi:maleate isomerase